MTRREDLLDPRNLDKLDRAPQRARVPEEVLCARAVQLYLEHERDRRRDERCGLARRWQWELS